MMLQAIAHGPDCGQPGCKLLPDEIAAYKALPFSELKVRHDKLLPVMAKPDCHVIMSLVAAGRRTTAANLHTHAARTVLLSTRCYM